MDGMTEGWTDDKLVWPNACSTVALGAKSVILKALKASTVQACYNHRAELKH